MKKGAHIFVTGIVQGVGFRPFVYSLATRLALTGWVRNTSAGVEIDVDGSKSALDRFARALRDEAPALACIEEIKLASQPAAGHEKFEILDSAALPSSYQPIPADAAICPDCLRELFDPSNRRYRYPFINCTNCGPRFTIIQDLPYDRPKTTMSVFPMCPECAAEYNDPLNRRFHAQPVACPNCGPRIWLEQFRPAKPGRMVSLAQMDGEAIHHALKLLSEGRIGAIKCLGGFRLPCDALNPNAVSELRQRKLRVDKPFAVRMPDMDAIARHCFVSEAERLLRESAARPIVLLRRRPE